MTLCKKYVSKFGQNLLKKIYQGITEWGAQKPPPRPPVSDKVSRCVIYEPSRISNPSWPANT